MVRLIIVFFFFILSVGVKGQNDTIIILNDTKYRGTLTINKKKYRIVDSNNKTLEKGKFKIKSFDGIEVVIYSKTLYYKNEELIRKKVVKNGNVIIIDYDGKQRSKKVVTPSKVKL